MKRVDQWIAFAKKSNKNLFFYEDKVLDLTGFMNIHPGGKKALINYLNKDITNIIFTVYPHNREKTVKTLINYVIGKIPEEDMQQRQKGDKNRSVTPVKEKKRVCFQTQVCLKQFQKKQQEEGSKSSLRLKINKVKQFKTKQSSKQKKNKDIKERPQSKDKSKKKSKKNIQKQQNQTTNGSFRSISSDLDEQKPIFKVPILYTKNIFLQ